MSVPVWKWTLTTPLPCQQISVAVMLRQWHSASRLGLELKSLEVDGVPVEPRVLDLLNTWIGCGGAFNASRQDYFEAWARLDRVLMSPYRRPRRLGGRGSP